ncbi:hypothetical protein BCR42DRAFT_448362 [Absidia repens]|uniref:MI domain-containing protein n=1 Tax=Absidia repens TaxID=90262 RepID=A0A1X2ISL2_9FUNG|nr:hypothetical protein BCR42DRAFT_448362 [Absidia repens]
MNSTPTNKDKNTNAKSTPQAVFNYAQAAKRNSQNSEQQQQKAKPTGPIKPTSSNPPTPPPKQRNLDDTTSAPVSSTTKANGNSNVNGSKPQAKSSAQSSTKPTFAAIANVSSAKQVQQSPRSAPVQLPRAPPVDKASIQFGSINQTTETATQPTSENTTKQEGQEMDSTVNSGNASAVDKPVMPQSRRDSTQSNPSAGEQSPAQSPHYQNATLNGNNNSNSRHYGGPRHYNQSKHSNAPYSPNTNNAQPGYMPHHAKKPISPHMASASPSAQNIPVTQNSWSNSIPGQYYGAPTYEARPQYYGYNQMPVQSYAQPGARQGGQQNFVPQAARTSKAIPIIDPNTKTQVKADPLTPASTSPSSAKMSKPSTGDKKEKDFKIQTSPSPKRTITIVDPAVKELEEREKREKEEAERLAKEEADRKVKEEAERAAKEEADRIAKEEADRIAKEEADRIAKEEADRKVKEEAERAAKEEADRIAKEETERIAKEEAEQLKVKQESERAAKEENERKERAAAAAAAVAEAERKVREECERTAAAERKVMEDEIQRVKRQLTGRKEIDTANNKNEEQRIAAITAEKAAKPAPGRLDLSGIPAHVLEGEPQTQSPSSPSSATPTTPTTPQKVVIPQRKIVDFSAIQYPETVTKAPTNSSGKIQYAAEFLLQFRALCLDSNEDLSAFQNIGDESNERSGSGRSHSNRRQPSERGGRGPRTPGGDMHRNNSRDGRMDSMGKFSGGRPLAHRAGSGNVSSPGSPGGGIQRDGSHGGRSRSGRGGGKGRHPPREQQGGPTIPLDQVVPLEKSENRWMPAVVATSGESGSLPVTKTEDELIPQEVIIRKVKSLLNKLTLEKFDSISDQIWNYAHQSAKEKDGQSLLTVIQLIFDKACDEAAFASMWAQLCRKLHDTMAAADDIHDENNSLDKNGNKITSGHLFRKYLFNRCQQAFERGWKFEIPDLEKSVSGEVMMTDEYYAAVKAKRQGLGLVQLIGELFKRGMLTDRIMTECLTRLCRNPQEAEDEETETMCKLVTTVGRELDRRNRNMKQWMDAFFERMKEMLECTTLTSRVKFMIQDVIELRRNKWVPRSGGATGPSTIAQIREDAQKAKNDEKESMKRTSSSRGNTPQAMSRQGSRASRNNSQREHATNKNTEASSSPAPAAAATSDGWSTVGTAAVSTPKGRTNDLDGFGRTDRSKSRNNVLGPGSSPFQTLNRSGTKNAKSDSKKGSPADSRSSSPASSMVNMFSALGGGDGHDESTEQQPTERKRLNLLPRGATLPAGDQASTNEESATEESKPKLTEQQMEQKAKDIIEEYILLRDEKELILCVKELEAPLPLVNKMLAVVEKKESEVKGVCEMIGVLNKENLVDKESYVEALKPFMEMYEDLTIDVPQAPKYMSQLLAAMNVDPSEVMEVEELDGTGYIPASTKLKQLYDDIKTAA